MSTLRAAVIGSGHLGTFHAQKYAQLGMLSAVVDTDAARRKARAAELNCPCYEDYKEILDKVDLVSVATPTVLHHSISCDFLRAGVHVLVEKPIALNCEEAREMIDLAAARSLVLQVGHIERFNPVFTLLKKFCCKPQYISIERLHPFRNRSTDINVVLDLMVHDLDLASHLIQSPIEDIRGLGMKVFSPHTDLANAHILFANGSIANISASRISSKPTRIIRVFQHDLYASANMKEHKLTILKKGGKQELREENYDVRDKEDALLAEIKSFAAAVENKTPPLVSGEDGMRTLAAALRLNKLLKEGEA